MDRRQRNIQEAILMLESIEPSDLHVLEQKALKGAIEILDQIKYE